jgi:WD40 repeat protein
MCPPLTTKNLSIYEPLLAAGTSSGTIQVFNVESGHLHREFIVHTSPVRGMDWLDMHHLLSFSYPTLMSGGVLVRNELKVVHVKSGICKIVRLSKEDEPVMESVKVSFSRSYFAVLIKDRPLELWDCAHLSLLRELSGDFPTPIVMEWSPINLPKNVGKQKHGRASSSPIPKELKILGKEHFVMTDSSNTLLHYTVEGSTIKEAVRIVLEVFGNAKRQTRPMDGQTTFVLVTVLHCVRE